MLTFPRAWFHAGSALEIDGVNADSIESGQEVWCKRQINEINEGRPDEDLPPCYTSWGNMNGRISLRNAFYTHCKVPNGNLGRKRGRRRGSFRISSCKHAFHRRRRTLGIRQKALRMKVRSGIKHKSQIWYACPG